MRVSVSTYVAWCALLSGSALSCEARPMLESGGGGLCSSCHGDPARVPVPGADALVEAAPPVDAHQQASSSAVGAHIAHVNPGAGSLSSPLACSECHQVPTDLDHVSRPVNVTFGQLATTSGARPVWSAANLSCSATYCHGGFTNGTHASPTWTGGPMACTSCHGAPPSTGRHGDHPGGTQCTLCHSDVANAAGSAITNPSKHVNGRLDVIGDGTWNNPSSCSVSCHN